MAGTTSWIISNLLSSLERLSFTSSSFIAGEVAAGEANSIYERVMEDLSRLSRMFRRIQAVLYDAEEREIYDKAIQLWLSELREVAYDVEDVLDKYDYQVLKTQVEGSTTIVEAEPSLKRKKVVDDYGDDDDYIYGYQASPSSSTSFKIPNSQVIKTQVEGMTTIVEAEPSLKRKQVDDDDDDDDFYGYQVCLHVSNSIKILIRKHVEDGHQFVDHNDFDQVSPSSFTSIKIPISYNMAEKIINIIEKFDEIAKDRKALQLREEDAPRRLHLEDAIRRPPSSSLVNDSDIFGRKDEKEKIIHLLMSDTEKENIIIPIVGLGGVGKTTLAQLVYNDPLVCKHFSPKVWVSVSEEFDVLRITKEIMKSIIKSSIHDDIDNLNDIQCILKEALLKKRFLLILDDVWNERLDIWEAFRGPFFGVGMGKIIVTTRSMLVARIMQTVPPHEVRCLDLEKSWLLFQRHAFYGWELHQQLSFEQIGREITKKCDGLPLALKAIGGFLRYEVKEQVWKDVLNNNLWELEETKNLILPALRISYNHMPGHLKSCFVYASLIPKDCEFEKEELMRMWIAQGYIKRRGRKMSFEDIALEYFEDLQRRSFFQLSRYGTHFTLHDMIHDLARSITRNEICSLTNFDELKKIPAHAKHIFTDYANIFRFHLFRTIRTFFGVYNYFHFDPNQLDQRICFEDSFPHSGCLRVLRFSALNFECGPQFLDLIDSLQQLRYLYIKVHTIQMTKYSLCSLYKLQTLVLEANELNMIPHGIGNLINLRYLGIHCGTLKTLSKSICKLGNLVTLNIKYCHQLRELPLGISRLTDLRHLILPNVESFYLPPDIEKMITLQSLSHFCVKRDKQYSTIGRLRNLMSLRGSLKIFKLQEVVSHEDAKSANLISMPHINRLKLCWRNIQDNECTKQNETVLDGLQPHTNLKELTIDGYGGNSFPSWFSNPHFSNMTKVTLKNFFNVEGCNILPLSGLPTLKSLHIRNIKGIKRLGHDFWCYTHLDGLEGFHTHGYLTNKSTPKTKELLMMRNGDFWNLKYVHIYFCHNMELLSSLPSSLEELEVTCCKSLQYVALHDSSGPLSKLQKLTIYYCHNLKSVYGLNNLLASLKVLKLGVCYNLNEDEYSHLSLASVSLEDKVSVCVIGCPGMRKWCQWHGFTYEESSSIDGKILEERINKMGSKGDMYYREFPDDLYSEMLRLLRI